MNRPFLFVLAFAVSCHLQVLVFLAEPTISLVEPVLADVSRNIPSSLSSDRVAKSIPISGIALRYWSRSGGSRCKSGCRGRRRALSRGRCRFGTIACVGSSRARSSTGLRAAFACRSSCTIRALDLTPLLGLLRNPLAVLRPSVHNCEPGRIVLA